jgi:serine/threonine protein kinase
VALVLVGLFFLWRTRRAQKNEKNRPFSFDTALSELRNRGVGDNTLDGKPREIKRTAVKLLDNIGEGAFGTVYKGLVDERSTTGVPEYTVAVKVLKNEPTGSEIKEFMREAAIMAQFKHPNVLSLVGVCTVGEPAIIVLQFCEHGSLLSFLKKHTGFQQLQLASKLSILADVTGGMAYLASCNVVHRDLATRNVLVGSDFVCKVSDFGLSREVDSTSADYYASPKGMLPLRWTAPEALKTRHFATTSDVWSFGITCGEVFDDGELVGLLLCFCSSSANDSFGGFSPVYQQPYATWENEQVWIHVQAGKAIACPATCPSYVFDMVIAPCFAENPAERPSFVALSKILQGFVDLPDTAPALLAAPGSLPEALWPHLQHQHMPPSTEDAAAPQKPTLSPTEGADRRSMFMSTANAYALPAPLPTGSGYVVDDMSVGTAEPPPRPEQEEAVFGCAASATSYDTVLTAEGLGRRPSERYTSLSLFSSNETGEAGARGARAGAKTKSAGVADPETLDMVLNPLYRGTESETDMVLPGTADQPV